MGITVFLSVAIGAGLGFLIAWLMLRSDSMVLNTRLASVQNDLALARAEGAKQSKQHSDLTAALARLEATLEHERKAHQEKLDLLDRATAELRDTFSALAGEALKSNNQAFLDLAQSSLEKFQAEAKGDLELRQQAVQSLVTPIGESLRKVDAQIQQIESARNEAYGDLKAQVRSLLTTQEKLQAETGNLVKALRTPTVRGRWGEIQL
ncbi:MAG TPA: DNA recombination protein RmuC, partial [Candidatus Angelobacter sp.]